jgi:hypothetical protein
VLAAAGRHATATGYAIIRIDRDTLRQTMRIDIP